MSKASFLVDGFNLYHSIVDAQRDLGGVQMKWLDIFSLCKSLLSAVKCRQMGEVYYFSAKAKHLIKVDPNQ